MAYVDLSTLHTPTPGGHPPATWGAQIRDNFDFLNTGRREIVTSSTRPTGFEGLEIYETDTNYTQVHDGTDWRRGLSYGAEETYTPTWTQAATITKTTTLSIYRRYGRVYEGNIVLAATSAGTASNAIKVTTPTTSSFSSNAAVGAGYYYNGSINFPIVVFLDSTTTFSFLPAFTGGGTFGTAAVFYPTGAGANTSFTPTVANTHAISFHYRIFGTV